MNMKKNFIFIIICIGVSFTLNIGNVIAENVIDGVGGYSVESCNAIGGIPTICGIPAGLSMMIHDIYNLLKICVPIVLIIMGMIDLLKGVASQKEDEIKKGWNTSVKRVLYGIIVFFVFFIVQFVVSILPDSSGKSKILGCVKNFFTGSGGSVECITKGANTGVD